MFVYKRPINGCFFPVCMHLKSISFEQGYFQIVCWRIFCCGYCYAVCVSNARHDVLWYYLTERFPIFCSTKWGRFNLIKAYFGIFRLTPTLPRYFRYASLYSISIWNMCAVHGQGPLFFQMRQPLYPVIVVRKWLDSNLPRAKMLEISL